MCSFGCFTPPIGDIEWTPELLAAFEAIKALFTKELNLRYFDPNQPIYFTSDMSELAVSGWIGQKDDKARIQPVICASKKLNTTQMRWGTGKKELYAAKWGMIKFRKYLYGIRFYMRVDHQSLLGTLRESHLT